MTDFVNTEIAKLRSVSKKPLRMLVKPRDDTCISLALSKNGYWEPYNTALIRCILERGDCFFDLGANLGYFSLIAADCVGENGSVIAFEPEPENSKFCEVNAYLNGFESTIAVYPHAIGLNQETRTLFRAGGNHGGHQLEYHFRDKQDLAGINVSVTSLDQFSEEHDIPSVQLIKMDVQGYETRALLGMKNLIKRNLDHLMVLAEFSPTLLSPFDDDQTGLARFYDILEQDVDAFFLIGRNQPTFNDVVVDPLNTSQLREIANSLEKATEANNVDACVDLLIFFSAKATQRFLQKAGSIQR